MRRRIPSRGMAYPLHINPDDASPIYGHFGKNNLYKSTV